MTANEELRDMLAHVKVRTSVSTSRNGVGTVIMTGTNSISQKLANLYQEIRELRTKHKYMSARDVLEGAPYAVAFDDRIKRLFPDIYRFPGQDDCEYIGLSQQSIVGLTRLPAASVNARAYRTPNGYVVGIFDGALRALFEMCAAVWTNPGFCAHIGTVVEDLSTAQMPDAPIPRGLEYVASDAIQAPKDSATLGPSSAPPLWINDALAQLCLARRYAFERTFFESLDFLLLHELGHVLGGHLSLMPETDGAQAFSELGSHDIVTAEKALSPPLSNSVKRGLEIEADAFALSYVFRRQRGLRQRTQPVDALERAPHNMATYAVLGATLPHLIFFASTHLANRVDRAEAHPPLWFRARVVLRAERYWASTDDETAISMDLHLTAVLRSFAEIHALFGQWLGPLTDMDRADPAKRVLDEARQALAPHRDLLDAARMTLRPKEQ